VRAIFWGEGPPPEQADIRDAEGTEWVALIVLGGCIVLFGVAPDLLVQYIDVATTEWLPKALGGAL
jgi:NADH:ubiquinone oxidoreductase subunit 4 (subunit M)